MRRNRLPPGWVEIERRIEGNKLIIVCARGCPPNSECNKPGETRACGNGGRQECKAVCGDSGCVCRWGPCVLPPSCPGTPTCQASQCSVTCRWEDLNFTAEASCATVKRRPFPFALVGVPVQMILSCGGVEGTVSAAFRGQTWIGHHWGSRRRRRLWCF